MTLNIKKIREDFPVLNKIIKNKPIIYFDSACQSLRPIQVIEKINEYYKEYPACGGRSLHEFGKRVTEEIFNSRRLVQKFFNARKQEEIIFTKNTTEAINLIANSLDFNKGDKILATDKEHNSNLVPWQLLAKRRGIIHEIIYSNNDNTFNMDEFNKKIKNTKLVSVVYTSNLDGVSNPVREIIKIAHENNALTLIDAAQSAPHKEIDVKKLDVDFLACSGHKMLGPSGTGILYGKKELLEELNPFIVGGDTVIDTTYKKTMFEKLPERFEAGLQNYSGVIGLGEAIKYLTRIGLKNIENYEINLNKRLTNAIIDKVNLIGPKNPELRGSIFSFYLDKIDSREINLILNESANIMIRSGAHCVHSWFNAHNIKGSSRVSFYIYNTEEEVDIFIKELEKILNL